MSDIWDVLVLLFASEQWRKVARTIALVSDRAGEGTNFDAIEARIPALVDDGKFQVKGGTSRWWYSEVRRVPSGSAGEST
jgi:hypothetical protein